MTETEIEKVAEKDDMIIQGYAFTKENDKIKVLNLHNTDRDPFLRQMEIFLKQVCVK